MCPLLQTIKGKIHITYDANLIIYLFIRVPYYLLHNKTRINPDPRTSHIRFTLAHLETCPALLNY